MSDTARALTSKSLVILLCLGTLAALPQVGADALYDDRGIVVANPLSHRPVQLGPIFATSYWAGAQAGSAAREYRPLTILSFALLDPGGIPAQRVANALLHGAVTALAAAVLAALGLAVPVALGAAALFAVHPVHAEVLGTVVGRAELLAAVAVLGGWRAHLAGRAGIAALCAAAGLLAKESAIVLLPLALAGDALRGELRDGARRLVPAGVATVAALGLRAIALGALLSSAPVDAVDNPLAALPPAERVLSGLASFAQALGLMLLPVNLVADRSPLAWTIASPADPRWMLGLAVALAPLVLARRAPRVALAMSIFVLPLVLVANVLFPVGTALAERLLYLPSLGVCVLLGLLVARARGSSRPRLALAVALAGWGLHVVAGAWALRPYRTEIRLWSHVQERLPGHPKAARNLAVALNERGRHGEAEAVLRDGLEERPEHAARYRALADTLALAGRLEEAVDAAGRAVALDPDRREHRLTHAGLLYDTERFGEALDAYAAVLERWPDTAEAWWYMGRLAERAGEREVAREAYGNAAALYGPGSEWGARAASAARRLSTSIAPAP